MCRGIISRVIVDHGEECQEQVSNVKVQWIDARKLSRDRRIWSREWEVEGKEGEGDRERDDLLNKNCPYFWGLKRIFDYEAEHGNYCCRISFFDTLDPRPPPGLSRKRPNDEDGTLLTRVDRRVRPRLLAPRRMSTLSQGQAQSHAPTTAPAPAPEPVEEADPEPEAQSNVSRADNEHEVESGETSPTPAHQPTNQIHHQDASKKIHWTDHEVTTLITWMETHADLLPPVSVSLWANQVAEEAFPDSPLITGKRIATKYQYMRMRWIETKEFQLSARVGRSEEECWPMFNEMLNKKYPHFWRLHRVYGTQPLTKMRLDPLTRITAGGARRRPAAAPRRRPDRIQSRPHTRPRRNNNDGTLFTRVDRRVKPRPLASRTVYSPSQRQLQSQSQAQTSAPAPAPRPVEGVEVRAEPPGAQPHGSNNDYRNETGEERRDRLLHWLL